MKFFLSALILLTAISSCKGEKSLSDSEKIEKSVRSYLFIGDSIDVEISVSDTIVTDDLNSMLAGTSENLNLIQLDIDTLASMIDELAYAVQTIPATEMDQDLPTGIISNSELLNKNQLLIYQLQYAQLNAQKEKYAQTNRVLFHLKRSVWANIAGFDVIIKYEYKGEIIETMVLMDAEFNVVD